MALRVERYGNTRFWALYDGDELVCVTVYKRGAGRAAAPHGPAPAAVGCSRPGRGHGSGRQAGPRASNAGPHAGAAGADARRAGQQRVGAGWAARPKLQATGSAAPSP